MGQSFLEQRNLDLLRDLDALIHLISDADIPDQLQLYRNQVLQHGLSLREDVELNLQYIGLGQDSILKDLLSKTQLITQETRLISSAWAIPILRAGAADRICLTTIQWIHTTHPKSSVYPPAFISGNCAIRPSLHIAPIYLFPTLEQQSLLYQPLFFHEFGHLLYVLHQPEMDDLVRELQYAVDELLMPVSQRNDRYAENMTSQRQIIADTWYAWAQELFCDAVGFTIGGPSFLHAFSGFLSTRDSGNYYRETRHLQYSSHPVTWLRVHFLSQRAKDAGFIELAKTVENEWSTVAEMMDILEDYHGYYDQALDQVITNTIQDMLTEANPRCYSQEEAAGGSWSSNTDSIVRLFNWAWQIRTNNFDEYPDWEKAQILRLLTE